MSAKIMNTCFLDNRDYYPFGSAMSSRSFTGASGYRFGYNTQLRSDELHQNHYTAQFWEYDSRVVKRWNTDPIGFPEISPYVINFNNPIVFLDPYGDVGGTDDEKHPDNVNNVPDDGKFKQRDGDNNLINKDLVMSIPETTIFRQKSVSDGTETGDVNMGINSDIAYKGTLSEYNREFSTSYRTYQQAFNDYYKTSENLHRYLDFLKQIRPGYDVNEAVQALNKNAQPNSIGYCAKYVRLALEAGGKTMLDRPGSAYLYNPYLNTKKEFRIVDNFKYKPIKGDIVVMSKFGTHKHGHIQMFNGESWISDFKQKDFWPGSSYRKIKPSYTIFRW